MSDLMSLTEAQRRVLDAVRPLEPVRVGLWDAHGLALAEPVVASEDVPPFRNSAMDGYAVRSEDTRGAPVELRVVGDLPAGHAPTVPVTGGTAVRIMTGAPLPEGADAVVRVEDTEPLGDRVRILTEVAPGTAVRPAGGDVAEGTLVFEAGTRLRSLHLGVLATLGVTSPTVRRRPRVGIMSTGDEVQPPEVSVLRPGWIRDANRPLLHGLLAELEVEIHDFGIVPDQPALLRSSLARAAERCDLVITSGGVSMGDYDVVKQVVTDVGDVELWRIAIQPAKPFAFGELAGVPFFGLPGNPVSVFVAFEQLVRPAVLAMMGSTRLFRPQVVGVLDEAIDTDPAKTVFVRVATTYRERTFHARSTGSQFSNVLSATALADAFAVVPVGVSRVDEGEEVVLEMFGWPESRTREEVLRG